MFLTTRVSWRTLLLKAKCVDYCGTNWADAQANCPSAFTRSGSSTATVMTIDSEDEPNRTPGLAAYGPRLSRPTYSVKETPHDNQ
jgi:hypothetical protein